jgi:hypothetical protein
MERNAWRGLMVGTLLVLGLGCAPQRDEPAEAPGGGGGQANEGAARRDDADKSAKTRTLEAGARVLQDTTPVDQLQMYLDGFHNYKREALLPKEKQHQMRAHHYCVKLNEDFIQCIIYDGNGKDAHIMGIEYIVSGRKYRTLPADEKKYWHPHDGEVDSGMLIAPGIPDPAHSLLMQDVRTTWGKTWHTWDPHGEALPFGEPALMWAIKPDQINAETRRQMQERKSGKPATRGHENHTR